MAETSRVAPNRIFRIEGPQTISDVERELADLENDCPERLLLPQSPSQWYFGGEAALIQLLVTWGHRNPNATLVTHITGDANPTSQLRKLIRRPFGFVGVWMAREITDRKETRSLRVQTNKLAIDEINWMCQGDRMAQESQQPSLFGREDGEEWDQPGVPGRGTNSFLASVDHYPKWRIPQCYFPTGQVRQHDDFVSLAESMTRRAAWGGETRIPPDLQKPLGSILHELFKNTHEWARIDDQGVPHLRSVRGLLAQAMTLEERQVAEVAGKNPCLATYLQNPEFRTPGGRSQFLELSIFDSGIGLARRWLSSQPTNRYLPPQIPLTTEYEACRQCFLRWKTSSNASHKGQGLHEVMEMLSKLQGVLRVRTGRLSLYRDFVAHPYRDSESTTLPLLADWVSETEKLTAMAPVEGTLYTMLFPINNRRP